MAAGRPAPKDSQMLMAAVAESATTQSTTSSTIRVVETEDQSNIECRKVLASRSDWHGTICGHGHVRSDRSDDRSRRL